MGCVLYFSGANLDCNGLDSIFIYMRPQILLGRQISLRLHSGYLLACEGVSVGGRPTEPRSDQRHIDYMRILCLFL